MWGWQVAPVGFTSKGLSEAARTTRSMIGTPVSHSRIRRMEALLEGTKHTIDLLNDHWTSLTSGHPKTWTRDRHDGPSSCHNLTFPLLIDPGDTLQSICTLHWVHLAKERSLHSDASRPMVLPMGEYIWICRVSPGSINKGKVKLWQEEGPSCLSLVQVLGCPEVSEVPVSFRRSIVV